MKDIYRELLNTLENGETAVLATVVRCSGSVPRHAGAKMLIKNNGTSTGTVGGGGVEQQVKAKATEILNSGQPQVLHFDLSGSGVNAAMICGGQMDVFLEPIAIKTRKNPVKKVEHAI
jgi:xanthine dehydrogenase accessory factor